MTAAPRAARPAEIASAEPLARFQARRAAAQASGKLAAAEDREHAVADELQDLAAFVRDRVDQGLDVLVQQCQDLDRGHGAGSSVRTSILI